MTDPVPLTLVPMDADQLAARLAVLGEDYAASVSTARSIPLAEARTIAEQQLRELLPDGVDTDGMLLFSAQVDGAPVGWVWIGLPGVAGRFGQAWVYDLVVDPDHRGRGYGRAIMLAAERELARLGVTSLGLNVFADNPVAIRLYESLGFQVGAQQMAKTVAPDDEIPGPSTAERG